MPYFKKSILLKFIDFLIVSMLKTVQMLYTNSIIQIKNGGGVLGIKDKHHQCELLFGAFYIKPFPREDLII